MRQESQFPTNSPSTAGTKANKIRLSMNGQFMIEIEGWHALHETDSAAGIAQHSNRS
jgi:hypothetical protein